MNKSDKRKITYTLIYNIYLKQTIYTKKCIFKINVTKTYIEPNT